MKKMQLSLSLFAVLIGLGLSFASFKPVKAKSAKFSTSWFKYSGSGSVYDAGNYSEVGSKPTCPGTATVCGIQATVGTGSLPVITTTLHNEISADLSSGDGSTNVTLSED